MYTEKWMQNRFRRALFDFNLIEPNDRIALGVSGGKDSVAMLHLLANLKYYRGFHFTLIPIHLDLGWENLNLITPNLKTLTAYCTSLGLSLHVESTQIAEIVFQVRQETRPCSLCAKLRRGALHNAAISLGCNKVALGHHADDVVETLFLNLFYTGQLTTFSPHTYLSKKDLVLIRPLIYLPEKALTQLTKTHSLPTFMLPCPAEGRTKRQEVKQIVHYLETFYPDLREKVITALGRRTPEAIWSRS